MPSFPNFGASSSYDRVAAVEMVEDDRGEMDQLGGNGNYSDSHWTSEATTTAAPTSPAGLGNFEIGGFDDDDVEHDDYYGSAGNIDEVDLEDNNSRLKPQHALSATSVSTTDSALRTRRPPSNYYCPLTLHLMEEPVLDGCGHCFDRDAITSWLNYHSICPISRKPLEIDDLIPETALQERIRHWHEVQRSLHGSDEPDLLSLSETDSHSQLELMLLPQERRVLSVIKFRKQVRTQRKRHIRCVWTVVAIVTLCFVTISFLAIYLYDVELRGPL
jgi:hypothetical protein